jgi:hypothetical protein
MPEIVPPDNAATDMDPGGTVPPNKAVPGSSGEQQDIKPAATANAAPPLRRSMQRNTTEGQDLNAAPPAAAVTVLNGKSEREIELERELGDANRVLGRTVEEKKQREIRIIELEDELKRLRQTPAEPKPLFSPFTFLNE